MAQEFLPQEQVDFLQKLFGGNARFGELPDYRIWFGFPVVGGDWIKGQPSHISEISRGIQEGKTIADILETEEWHVFESRDHIEYSVIAKIYNDFSLHPVLNAYVHGINRGTGVAFDGSTALHSELQEHNRSFGTKAIVAAHGSGALFDKFTKEQLVEFDAELRRCALTGQPDHLGSVGAHHWDNGKTELNVYDAKAFTSYNNARKLFAQVLAENWIENKGHIWMPEERYVRGMRANPY